MRTRRSRGVLPPGCATASSSYWDIDVETLVAPAVDDLPDMITQLESAIASLQEPEGTDPAL